MSQVGAACAGVEGGNSGEGSPCDTLVTGLLRWRCLMHCSSFAWCGSSSCLPTCRYGSPYRLGTPAPASPVTDVPEALLSPAKHQTHPHILYMLPMLHVSLFCGYSLSKVCQRSLALGVRERAPAMRRISAPPLSCPPRCAQQRQVQLAGRAGRQHGGAARLEDRLRVVREVHPAPRAAPHRDGGR